MLIKILFKDTHVQCIEIIFRQLLSQKLGNLLQAGQPLVVDVELRRAQVIGAECVLQLEIKRQRNVGAIR